MRGRMCGSPKHAPAQAGAQLGDGTVHRPDLNSQTDRFVVSFLRNQESINISLEWIPACAGMTKCDMSLLNTHLWQCPTEKSVSP